MKNTFLFWWTGKFKWTDIDWYQYLWCDIKEKERLWIMWWLTGWPFKRRCEQCCGSGLYQSESSARYGDKPDKCNCCNGTGLVKRSMPWHKR